MLFLNAIAAVTLMEIRFKSRRIALTAVGSWIAINALAMYWIVQVVGITSLEYTWAGLNVQWYTQFLVVAVVLLLLLKAKLDMYSTLAVFCLAGIFSMFKDELTVARLVNSSDALLMATSKTFGLLFSFWLAFMIPVWVFFTEAGESIRSRLFSISLSQIKTHQKVLLRGFIWFCIAYMVTNIWTEGKLLSLWLSISPGYFVRDVVYSSAYLVLIDHFVLIAFAKLVINRLFPDEPTSMWEILAFGLLFAVSHYYLPVGYIVREFLYGLIFGYWYLKTGSLTYGIILRTMSYVLSISVAS
jgi:hypothetical protein